MEQKWAKFLEVANGEIVRETKVDYNDSAPLTEAVKPPYPRGRYNEMTVDPLKVDMNLTEAAVGQLSVSNFPDLLRLGVQFDAFTGFNETVTVWDRIARTMPSDQMQEEYADDEGIGLPPIVLENQDYPEIAVSTGGGKIIPNYKRGFVIHVSEEIMRFDKWGKVRETSANIGRAFPYGRDQSVLNILTTTTNYNVLNNNDQAGNNYQTLTFTPTNLNTALALMMTQKDRKSGQYIGVMPTTLVVGPLLERFARMLISSPDLNRQGGPTTSEVYGGGTNNPFFGVLTEVIVSPMFGASYQWALLDKRKAIYLQQVEPFSVYTEAGNMTSESWIKRDSIRYKARDWYGAGMRDDRFAFYSDSTSAPAAS